MRITTADPPAPERFLRRMVVDHVTSERRRTFPPVLHVGRPGLSVADLPLDDEPFDHALRTDALEAMVRRLHDPDAPRPLVWLTRRGTLEAQDIDLRWSSAAQAAAAELSHDLPMVVVTRQGWRDPRTGAAHTWRRLRPDRV
ncbi:hypothetical protein BH09ACT6_BH09ACT6_19020 [soil metagenome]